MVSHKKLKKFTKAVFQKMGLPEDHAERAADVLISADLRGIDSHGVGWLSGYVHL
jgi:LDH2 family malate/lactate/ureidoglycolate dehydrogenase